MTSEHEDPREADAAGGPVPGGDAPAPSGVPERQRDAGPEHESSPAPEPVVPTEPVGQADPAVPEEASSQDDEGSAAPVAVPEPVERGTRSETAARARRRGDSSGAGIRPGQIGQADPGGRRARRRRRAALTARISASAAVAVLVPLSVLGAIAIPQLPLTADIPVVSVQPAADSRTPICPGPLRLQNDANASSVGTAIGSADARAASDDSSGVQLSPLGGAAAATAGGAPGSGLAVADAKAATTALLASAPSGGAGALVGAAQSERVSSNGLAGTAVTGCSRPSSDAWLVGGETTTGRTLVLRLTNASSGDADVTIQAYTQTGAVAATHASVPAAGDISLPLAAIAPDATQLAVHLTTEGAPVAAYLQQTSVDALTSAGVDIWGQGADPATSVTIPGVVVAGHGASVRLVSEAATTASVTVVSASGGTGLAVSATLAAGVVADVPLTGLGDGSYVVQVSADQPVSAAAVSSADAAGAVDFGWMPSASASASTAVFAVPTLADPGTSESLAIYPSAAGTATLTDAAGTVTTLTLVQGTPVVQPISPGGYALSTDVPVSAAIQVSGAGTAAGYPITTAAQEGTGLTVFPR